MAIHNLIKTAMGLGKLPLYLLVLLGLTLAFLGCNDENSSDDLQVVTTTSFVADWARQVGDDRVEVFSLTPLGADPHTYQPGAGDISRIAQADLVLSLALTFEFSSTDRLMKNIVSDPSKLIAFGEMVQPLPFEESEEEHGEFDPHFWFDPLRVKAAVTQIVAKMSDMDPEGAQTYSKNASQYIQQLNELHRWIQEQVAQIPEERRLLVTSHESLGYFANRYGFKVVGAIIPSLTTEQEPSAQTIAHLVEEIKEHNAPAIFTESTLSDRLAQSIAQEAGVEVVTKLYTESLGLSGSGADTYINMMRHNVQAIVEALK